MSDPLHTPASDARASTVPSTDICTRNLLRILSKCKNWESFLWTKLVFPVLLASRPVWECDVFWTCFQYCLLADQCENVVYSEPVSSTACCQCENMMYSEPVGGCCYMTNWNTPTWLVDIKSRGRLNWVFSSAYLRKLCKSFWRWPQIVDITSWWCSSNNKVFIIKLSIATCYTVYRGIKCTV